METVTIPIIAIGAMGSETDDKTILSYVISTTKVQNLGKSNTKA